MQITWVEWLIYKAQTNRKMARTSDSEVIILPGPHILEPDFSWEHFLDKKYFIFHNKLDHTTNEETTSP